MFDYRYTERFTKRQDVNLGQHPLYGAQSSPSILFAESTAALLADGYTLLGFLPLETFSPLQVRKVNFNPNKTNMSRRP